MKINKKLLHFIGCSGSSRGNSNCISSFIVHNSNSGSNMNCSNKSMAAFKGLYSSYKIGNGKRNPIFVATAVKKMVRCNLGFTSEQDVTAHT